MVLSVKHSHKHMENNILLYKQDCQGAKPPLSWNEQVEPNFELTGLNEWNGTNYTILYWVVVAQGTIIEISWIWAHLVNLVFRKSLETTRKQVKWIKLLELMIENTNTVPGDAVEAT